jgi:hypothetical protein
MLQTYLIIAWFALPTVGSSMLLCARRPIRPIWIGVAWLASAIAGTFLLANYVWAIDAQLLAEIDKYEPGTPEANRASEDWASDTGRSFLLLLSPLLTATWYGAVPLLLFGLRWIVRKKLTASHATANARKHAQAARQPGKDRPTAPPPLID